jgi:hypothetical protein
MVVLRCTQKLLARLKQSGDLPAIESTTLGDWYGNVLQLGRRQHLLFISERSRLPVVIPIREGKRLAEVFPEAVCEVLTNVGVAATTIADERSRMSEIAFGPTRNRSLLGTLNDFAFMAQVGSARRPEPETAEELTRFLAQTPILPAERRKPNRVDISGVPWRVARTFASLRHDRSGAAWARQDYPSALRGLDPPGALPSIGNCRSDDPDDACSSR